MNTRQPDSASWQPHSSNCWLSKHSNMKLILCWVHTLWNDLEHAQLVYFLMHYLQIFPRTFQALAPGNLGAQHRLHGLFSTPKHYKMCIKRKKGQHKKFNSVSFDIPPPLSENNNRSMKTMLKLPLYHLWQTGDIRGHKLNRDLLPKKP